MNKFGGAIYKLYVPLFVGVDIRLAHFLGIQVLNETLEQCGGWPNSYLQLISEIPKLDVFD